MLIVLLAQSAARQCPEACTVKCAPQTCQPKCCKSVNQKADLKAADVGSQQPATIFCHPKQPGRMCRIVEGSTKTCWASTRCGRHSGGFRSGITKKCADPIQRLIEKLKSVKVAPAPNRPPTRTRTLQFKTCGGITNQRIEIISAISIALATNRTLQLPRLSTDGKQDPMNHYREDSKATFVPFRTIFDQDNLRRSIPHIRLSETALPEVAPGRGVHIDSKMLFSPLPCWRTLSDALDRAGVADMKLECPLFSVDFLQADWRHFWHLDATLIFSPSVHRSAGHVLARLGTNFTALHLRAESDWPKHCQSLESTMGAKPKLCYRNTDVVHNTLLLEGVPTDRPLFLASGVRDGRGLEQLKERYAVVRAYSDSKGMPAREIAAAIDMLVCNQSTTFIGNSWSTFTAYLLFARQTKYNNDFHYNGGHVPLARFVPQPPLSRRRPRALKCVFTMGLTSARSTWFAFSIARAVTSLLARTTMIPIVVVHGEADGLTRWLERKGCRVLFWTPVWERQLVDLYEAAQAKTMSRAHAMVEGERRQEARLPLLSSSSVFASAFLRLDISQMGFVDEFVLYTDADVVFLRDLTLVELQRPSVLACAPEDQFSVPFPCNSGGILL